MALALISIGIEAVCSSACSANSTALGIGEGATRLELGGFACVAIAFFLNTGSYYGEIFRAGIESVHPSQRLAARSLGLNYGQTMRHIVLPQAVRRVAPPLMNDFVALQKDVGLISVLGAIDAVRGAQIEVAKYANFTPYVLAGLIFVLLAIPTVRLTDHLAARLSKREQSGVTL